MIDLYGGPQRARSDERFHVQLMQPSVKRHLDWLPLFKFTSWVNLTKADGSPGSFCSLWIYRLQIYWGSSKCDPTRTSWLNTGQLGDPTPGYIMTTTPKEMWAFRWRTEYRKPPVWTDMGGS